MESWTTCSYDAAHLVLAGSITVTENGFTFRRIGANDKSFNPNGAHTSLPQLGMT
jgi:hypothetical protein